MSWGPSFWEKNTQRLCSHITSAVGFIRAEFASEWSFQESRKTFSLPCTGKYWCFLLWTDTLGINEQRPAQFFLKRIARSKQRPKNSNSVQILLLLVNFLTEMSKSALSYVTKSALIYPLFHLKCKFWPLGNFNCLIFRQWINLDKYNFGRLCIIP